MAASINGGLENQGYADDWLYRTRRGDGRVYEVQKRKTGRGGDSGGGPSLNRFTVFVDRIKKIHSYAIRKFFERFDETVYIYIAYKNKKRADSEFTFDFVRFKWEVDMKVAIRDGNNVWLYGNRISVSKANNFESLEVRKKVVSAQVQSSSEGGKEDKSYRNALLSKAPNRPSKSTRVHAFNSNLSERFQSHRVAPGTEFEQRRVEKPLGEPLLTHRKSGSVHGIPVKDMEWLETCLCGIVRDEFDVEEAERGLNSVGLVCRVLPWRG